MTRAWTQDEEDALRRLVGQGKSAKAIAKVMGRSHDGVRIRANRLGLSLMSGRGGSPRMALALSLLGSRGPMLSSDLAELIGVRAMYVRRVMLPLIRRGEAHIVRYVVSGFGKPKAIYAAGNGESARPPKIRSKPQVQRDYRKRMKREQPEEYDLKWKRHYARRRVVKRADIAAAWISGGGK